MTFNFRLSYVIYNLPRKYVKRFNPFLAHVPILHPLKTPENLWFSGVFRRYKIGTLARNGLLYPFMKCCEALTHFMPLVSFYTPCKTSENLCFQGVYIEKIHLEWGNSATSELLKTSTAHLESTSNSRPLLHVTFKKYK